MRAWRGEGFVIAVLCVGAGGFIGAVFRYALGAAVPAGDFPWATFAINFIGAVVIGFVVGFADARPGALSDNAVLFLKTGLCGGFTTFSTFSLETLTLIEGGRYWSAGAYAAGSVAACVAGVAVGRAVALALAPAVSAS